MRKETYWTRSAYECYKNNCQCSYHCENYEVCMAIAKSNKSKPPMLDCVESLVNQGIAIPIVYSDLIFNNLETSEINTLDLLILQDKTPEEIAVLKNMTLLSVAQSLTKICKALEFRKDWLREGTLSQQLAEWGKKNIAKELEEYVRCGVVY